MRMLYFAGAEEAGLSRLRGRRSEIDSTMRGLYTSLIDSGYGSSGRAGSKNPSHGSVYLREASGMPKVAEWKQISVRSFVPGGPGATLCPETSEAQMPLPRQVSLASMRLAKRPQRELEGYPTCGATTMQDEVARQFCRSGARHLVRGSFSLSIDPCELSYRTSSHTQPRRGTAVGRQVLPSWMAETEGARRPFPAHSICGTAPIPGSPILQTDKEEHHLGRSTGSDYPDSISQLAERAPKDGQEHEQLASSGSEDWHAEASSTALAGRCCVRKWTKFSGDEIDGDQRGKQACASAR